MGKKSGFTLAEIIITLTIIGMIAAMTIPTMIQNVQDKQFRTAWKKAYANLDQVTRLLIMDNGGSLKGLFTDADTIRNKYKSYLNYVKECSEETSIGTCWHGLNKWKSLSGDLLLGYNVSSLILNNGSLIRFDHRDINCNDSSDSINRCGQIWIDINGWEEPNTIGRDIFIMHILADSIKPLGTQGDNYINTCDSTHDGEGCSAKYLYQ